MDGALNEHAPEPGATCWICENRCTIPEGGTGRCRMYTARGGGVIERFPDQYFAIYPVNIESMPMLHYMPNGKFLLVSTTGCNFSCPGCVSDMLTMNTASLSRIMKHRTPGEIVKDALSGDCRGIVFCLNEPTVAYFTFRALARVAKAAGLAVGFSTNGYMTPEALDGLLEYADFVNVGLKGSSVSRYEECGAASPEPSFRAIKAIRDAGRHVEVSLMHLRGQDDEVIRASERIAAISPDIPLQVMRFMSFGTTGIEHQPEIDESEALCEKLQGLLSYVYLFNSAGTPHLNTLCPSCGQVVIRREFKGPMGAKVTAYEPGATCTCGTQIDVHGPISTTRFSEPRYLGGYRLTRGIDVIRNLLDIAGVTDDQKIVDAWIDAIESGLISELHGRMKTPEAFFETFLYFAGIGGCRENAERIVGELAPVVEGIRTATEDVPHPTVYGAMANIMLPLFDDKMDIALIEAAGGRCLNRELAFSDTNDKALTPAEINRLNPEVIFVFGRNFEVNGEYPEKLKRMGISVPAVQEGRVFGFYRQLNYKPFDWFVSLMDIANKLHPELFDFDIEEEARRLEALLEGPEETGN